MPSSPSYQDNRPPKRPRHDDMFSGVTPYGIPGPSANPDPNVAPDGVAKRNRKRPLSCGECRRLKLKCDRVFPCQSCYKRGCAEICPDGALTGGKGSRFILANTEQLHDKIKSMAERIRQLEEALQHLHSQHSPEQHPLLRQELLSIKRSPELFGVERNGVATTEHARREDDDHPSNASASSAVDAGDDYQHSIASSATLPALGLPEDIARLSRTCPAPTNVTAGFNPQLRQRIREMLPPRHDAQRICDQARRNAFWHCSPDASESFLPNLMHSVYTTSLDALLPHRLSLFLMILAIGSAVDFNNHDRDAAERYHHLARAALCEIAIVDDPSLDTIYTLFYMVWYLLMFSTHKQASEHAWGLMGLLAKLAQSLGLHSGCGGKMIPEELDKRKALLWNMINVDVRLALMLRRPPSMSLHHVAVKRPAYRFFDAPSPSVSAAYHEWRDDFLEQCQFPVLELVVAPEPPSYSEVLALDGKIRDFEIPKSLDMLDNDGMPPVHPTGLQRALTMCTREIAILHLHRGYLTQAVSVTEGFTINHKYSPSVLACYSSACNLLWCLHACCRWEPELSMRLSVLWSNGMSAVLSLLLILGRAPSSPLSPHILKEVDKVVQLYAEAREQSAAAARILPAIEQCTKKARSIYEAWRTGSVDSCWVDHSDRDEVCAVARRAGLLPPEDPGMPAPPVPTEVNPFLEAHPFLRRCHDQFAVEMATNFADPLPRQLESSLRFGGGGGAYNTSAERTVPPAGNGADRGVSHAGNESSQYTSTGGYMGTEFSDRSLMTWF